MVGIVGEVRIGSISKLNVSSFSNEERLIRIVVYLMYLFKSFR